MIELNRIYNEDCLEGMKRIPDKSVDMILCDLPYGTTACKWDTVIPFEPLWEQYERIIKDNGAIVLTATNPFSSMLVASNAKGFKHEWVWDKVRPSGFQVAKYKPMQRHENVLVFTSKRERVNYFPIMELRDKPVKGRVASSSESSPLKYNDGKTRIYTHKNPQSIIVFPKPNRAVHPTQKPVALFEYLIKTYTNEGEIVLDNCIGSGTTAIACINTNRNYIGFELDKHYCEIANERIQKAMRGVPASDRSTGRVGRNEKERTMQNTENAITIDELIDELRSFHATSRNLIHKQRYTRDKLQDMSLEIANLKTALESEIEDTEYLMTGIKMNIERLEKLYSAIYNI